ncbi:Clas15 [Clostera anastomosis granulovirus B]|uniref:Clas15 n=1 Tax=Clostera anastomosis granulovirus B TaxID=1986290 RepID=A0A0K0WSG6_9BBAC|nr:Clas15 [Clostera anastomosis granulovirus B]AKS25358.1 Clas15 [Clostera anastomosis granulovirus B]
MTLFYITVDSTRIPIITVADLTTSYIGLNELKQYYCINGPTHTDVLLECCTYRELVGNNDTQFEANKLFVSRVGAVLLFESNNIHYTCYWYIFSIIDNVVANIDGDNNGNGGGDQCKNCTALLENIQKDVTVIKQYVTVNPFE